jgi:hypothetical protein
LVEDTFFSLPIAITIVEATVSYGVTEIAEQRATTVHARRAKATAPAVVIDTTIASYAGADRVATQTRRAGAIGVG